MNITIELPDEMIADTLRTAIENSCGYWCRVVDEFGTSHGYAGLVDGRSSMVIRELNDNGRPSGPALTLDAKVVAAGVKRMAEQYPRHFGDMVSENHDAVTADVLLQLALLGEIRYG